MWDRLSRPARLQLQSCNLSDGPPTSPSRLSREDDAEQSQKGAPVLASMMKASRTSAHPMDVHQRFQEATVLAPPPTGAARKLLEVPDNLR